MRGLVLALVLLARTATAQSGTPVAPPLPYDTLFYQHDGLKLEAYLYKPAGTGPFPLVVYNHGSAPAGRRTPGVGRRRSSPASSVPAGYAVLVPERRGYGKSEGRRFSEEIGRRPWTGVCRAHAGRGGRHQRRRRARAGAARLVDRPSRASRSWARRSAASCTTLAASRSARFAAAAVQAPGALNWERSESLRAALLQAAAKIKVPLQCVVAENDATTASAREICAAAAASGARATLKIYPPFTGGNERPGNPPGHAVFGPRGVSVWDKDLLAFLSNAMRP